MSAPPRYRYLLAGLIFAIRTYSSFIILIPAVYVGELMEEFGLSSAAVGNYVGFLMWACAAVVLFAGPIASKLGSKRCGLTGTILLVVGMFLTALTPTNYILACAIRFLLGLGMVLATVAFMPVTMTWFTAEEFGRINSVIEASSIAGILLNFTFTAALFPGLWREAHLAFGTVGVILAVLWAILGRNPLIEFKEEENYLHMLRTRLPKLFRIKEVLLMGGVMWMSMGVTTAVFAWIPSYLEWEWRWAPYAAALLVSVNNICNVCSFALGGTLSDKVGLRRPFLIMGGPMVFLCSFMAVTFVGPMTWLWYALAGIFVAIYGFTTATIPMEHPEMDPELIGTAISIVVFIGFIGGALMPTVLGAILDVTGSLYIGMAASSALYLLVALFGLLCRETGWKAAEKE